jgi:hypothetical protein
MPRRPIRTSLVVALAAVGLVAPLAVGGLLAADAPVLAEQAAAEACPPGTITLAKHREQEARLRASLTARDAAADLRQRADSLLAETAGSADGCVTIKTPEPFGELMARAADLAQPRLAGMGADYDDRAFAAALDERAQMVAGSVPGTAGAGKEYGRGPLLSEEPYGTVGLGIPFSMGRVDDLEYDAANDFMFAAVGTGGIWMSPDKGDNWYEINGNLPGTTVYSVAWTSAGGGRLVLITGDGTFGGITGFPGFGAYWSDDIGGLDRNNIKSSDVTWTKAAGVPDGALGFKVAVDKSSPNRVYVATSKGLFRSTDAGTSFTNVNLPTGDCAGVTNTSRATGGKPECHLANVVTDVVVQTPGGATGVTTPIVVAAVGWRGGNFENPDETVQSPANGIYRSTDGGATFARSDESPGFAPQNKIGRLELGAATGPDQDHGYLWAMVQDAEALNGAGCAVLDAPVDCSPSGAPTGINTILDGIYMSPDFGDTWVQVATAEEFQGPNTGSALNGTAQALGYQPGVQAWYNQFVEVDPTQHVGGVPTRLMIGLEEVWENTDTSTPSTVPPQKPPVSPGQLFRVVGRYFGGTTCGFLNPSALTGGFPVPVCPLNTQDPVTGAETTHPDQHSALFIPTEDGVTLYVGNDGGVNKQTKPALEDFDNTSWGKAKVLGFQTLLPYGAAAARDGRVWFGLQDNGSGFVDPKDGFKQKQTFGGDGFFMATDPFNSDIAYYETPGATMNVTTDGGITSSSVAPPSDGGPYRFNNQFRMDPNDALHLVTAGSKVYDSQAGPGSTGEAWEAVADLGFAKGSTTLKNAMSAIEVERNAIYVGFCGTCDILNQTVPFQNGIATNVGGSRPARAGTSDGWRVAVARGLPNRFITSIEIDPEDQNTIYVTLGGYSRKWASPGTLQDKNPAIGSGHVFKSTDAGETFTDWSGNLPDVTATWVTLRGDQVLVGTDVGAFASRSDGAPVYAPLEDVPATSIGTIEMMPGNPNRAIIATYGRGIWSYDFDDTRARVQHERVAGPDRIHTAVEISKDQFDSAHTVVVASAEVYADSLAAVPLAAWNDGPILLTNKDGLSATAAAEIQRLGVDKVIIAGGPNTISDAVFEDLVRLGVEVKRVFGSNRFATAAAIAKELPAPETVYVAEGANADPSRGWPDALAMGPVAAVGGHPILLVTTDTLPVETATALRELLTAEVNVVGGPAAVSDAVMNEIKKSGAKVRRLSGANRFETSTVVADAGLGARLTDHRLFYASGGNWPDALAAGAAIAVNGGSLLLTPPTDFLGATSVLEWTQDHSLAVDSVKVIGGPVTVTDTVRSQIQAVIAAGPPPPPKIEPIKGETLAEFGFETEAQGWTVMTQSYGDTADLPKNGWQLRAPGDTSAQSFRIEPYQDETLSTLTSPAISHPGGTVRLTWRMMHNTEECCDFVTWSWSSDGKTFNGLGGVDASNASFPNFDTFTAEFVAPPGPLYIRFALSSDQLVSGHGAAIDNVKVER